jgi:hypothetical protein
MANGKAGTDRSRIGLVFAKEPPTERVHSITITNLSLVIPPGVADFPFQANYALPLDVKLVSLNPHMHLRGKSFEFRAIYPTGESEVLLRVPNYSFSWQLYYYGSAQESDGTPIFIGARRRHVPGATNRFGFRKCVIINVYRLSK